MKETEKQKWCSGSEGQGYLDPVSSGTSTMLPVAARDGGENRGIIGGEKSESEALSRREKEEVKQNLHTDELITGTAW